VVAHGWNIDFGGVNSTAARVQPLVGTESPAELSNTTCTLLGPEGPGTSSNRWARLDRTRMRLDGFLCAAGTARILRTTQWTRAS